MDRSLERAPGILGALVAMALSIGLAAAETPVDFEGEPPAAVEPAPPPASPAQVAAAQKAWLDVFRVLTHPRCMNCHPKGDRPLQTDASVPHRMNIGRASMRNGLMCNTCHREVNSEALGIAGGPPGAPHWGLPPEDVPMVFEGHTPTSLCVQLKDRDRNGGRDLQALLKHVSDDALVKWGWNPGGDRTKPPLSHPAFVKAFSAWVAGNGACPDEEVAP